MTKIQDPVTSSVASALGMTAEECDANPRRAARRAARVLRENGFRTDYCHRAWERGVRWYYKGSDIPERDLCATSLLGIAMIDGRIGR